MQPPLNTAWFHIVCLVLIIINRKNRFYWIDCFKLWCWRRLLRVPWTAGRSNQSMLKEISPEYSLEGLMLKLKLQRFGHLYAENWLTGKDPNARKDWRQEKGMTEDEIVEWDHRLDGHEFEQSPGVGDAQGNLTCCSPSGRKVSETTELLNQTELSWYQNQ